MSVQYPRSASTTPAYSARASVVPAVILIGVATTGSHSVAAQTVQAAFVDGKVDGNIRAYYNTRDYDHRLDEAGFSLGGALRAESGKLGVFVLGAGFYTAQDLDTDSSNPARVNNRLGSDLEVLGEAYLKVDAGKTVATLGRQKITTPFANPGDAFIIPFTFQGYSLTGSALTNLNFHLSYLNEIKNRNSEEFVDVGLWSSNRYGLASPGNTSGTINLGAMYAAGPVKTELWLSRFTDFFDMAYWFGQYQFSELGTIKPFIAGQWVEQKESGDAWLGKVDSTLYGVQLGATLNKFKLTMSYNDVTEQQDAFLSGAVLAPYSFSTSPLFTNNMLETLENLDAGNAARVAVGYAPTESISLLVSHARFNFSTASDRNATDLDITYAFAGSLQGFSLRWRMEKVEGDVVSVEQINHRFQTQFVF